MPKVFAGLFEQDIPVKGQIGMVLPPPEIDKYVAKVETAARKDPKWFREFSGQAKPGVPLPYDERLGLTKEEYAEYLALWNKREFKPMEEVMLLLRQSSGGTWSHHLHRRGQHDFHPPLRREGRSRSARRTAT